MKRMIYPAAQQRAKVKEEKSEKDANQLSYQTTPSITVWGNRTERVTHDSPGIGS